MHKNPQQDFIFGEVRCLTPADVRLIIRNIKQGLRKDRNRRMVKGQKRALKIALEGSKTTVPTIMMRIKVERIWELYDEIAEINRLDLGKIQWTLDGTDLVIDLDVIESFSQTGLMNTDFIRTNYWRKGIKPEVLTEAGLDL